MGSQETQMPAEITRGDRQLVNQSSQQRSESRKRQIAQMEERLRISTEIDRSRMDIAHHSQRPEQHLERTAHDDEELLALKQKVQDEQRKIADRGEYDYERANANFDARYETKEVIQAGGWVLVTSKVRVSPEVRKTLTERKLDFDFKNRFHLEKGFIDLEENYRDVDKKAKVGDTDPMFFSNILQQQSRRAAMKVGADLSKFRPIRLRAKNIYEKDTLETADDLKDARGNKLKKGALKKYSDLNLVQISDLGAGSHEELAKRRVMSHTSWKRHVIEHEERNHYERVYHIPHWSLHPSRQFSSSGSETPTDQAV